ncbi:endonuclease-reverse transcriptase domain-containing protein [Hirsutella rhossiliensis]
MNDEDLKGYRALAISEPGNAVSGFDSGNPSATRLISNVAGFRGELDGEQTSSSLVTLIATIYSGEATSLLPRGTKTWQGRDSESTLDLVLALAELADEMVICNIHPMEHGSDHIVFDEGGEPCVDGASLLQAEVVALLGSPAEFTNSSAWAYLNTYLLYWHVFRQESGVGSQMIPWSIAFSIICRQLDLIRQNDGGDVGQLCQFIGGEGGTGKSRIIEALVELFRIAAVRINSITIHPTCGFSKDQGAAANTARDPDEVRLPSKRIGSSMASFG